MHSLPPNYSLSKSVHRNRVISPQKKQLTVHNMRFDSISLKLLRKRRRVEYQRQTDQSQYQGMQDTHPQTHHLRKKKTNKKLHCLPSLQLSIYIVNLCNAKKLERIRTLNKNLKIASSFVDWFWQNMTEAKRASTHYHTSKNVFVRGTSKYSSPSPPPPPIYSFKIRITNSSDLR